MYRKITTSVTPHAQLHSLSDLAETGSLSFQWRENDGQKWTSAPCGHWIFCTETKPSTQPQLQSGRRERHQKRIFGRDNCLLLGHKDTDTRIQLRLKLSSVVFWLLGPILSSKELCWTVPEAGFASTKTVRQKSKATSACGIKERPVKGGHFISYFQMYL